MRSIGIVIRPPEGNASEFNFCDPNTPRFVLYKGVRGRTDTLNAKVLVTHTIKKKEIDFLWKVTNCSKNIFVLSLYSVMFQSLF